MTSGRPVVGVTGLPCAGKSYVADLLVSSCVAGEEGVIVRADDLGHDALRRPEIVARLAERFGRAVLNRDGTIDRTGVARIVFADAGALAWLEGVIHPAVVAEAAARIAAVGRRRLVAVEAALLFAAGMDRACDLVLVVEAPWEVRLARAAKRGWDAAELARRESRLLPLFDSTRLAACPAAIVTIENNAPDDELVERLRAAIAVVGEGKEKP